MNDWTPRASDPAIDFLLVSVQEAIVSVTGSSLVGLYLFGSLATGDFDFDVSDIDLIAVLADTPNERLATRLTRMHEDLAQANPEWDDRIETSSRRQMHFNRALPQGTLKMTRYGNARSSSRVTATPASRKRCSKRCHSCSSPVSSALSGKTTL